MSAIGGALQMSAYDPKRTLDGTYALAQLDHALVTRFGRAAFTR
jgi:hypothetical protein